jgi:DNA helicase-2/ATP-dependent DNA helicase PcrA
VAHRVERIAAKAISANAAAMADALKWSGTFHAIGARLIREYAERIGLDRSFTIHDREDSADLMNLVRHDLGFSKTEKRFPTKGTCLAIYSRAVNSETPLDQLLGSVFPWCAMWHAELRRLSSAYVDAKQNQNVLDYDDLLLYWAQMMAEPAIATDVRGRFDHVLVDEYQDTNRLQASILLSSSPTAAATVVGDDAQSSSSFAPHCAQHLISRTTSARPYDRDVDQNYRSTQPTRRRQCGHRSRGRALHRLCQPHSGELPQQVSEADRREHRTRCQCWGNRETRYGAQGKSVCSSVGPQRTAEVEPRGVIFRRQVRRPEILDAAHVKDARGVGFAKIRAIGLRAFEFCCSSRASARRRSVRLMTWRRRDVHGLRFCAAARAPGSNVGGLVKSFARSGGMAAEIDRAVLARTHLERMYDVWSCAS